MEISSAGGRYTLKTLSELSNTESSFVPGEELSETIEDGRIFATTFTVGDGKLVQLQPDAPRAPRPSRRTSR